MSWIMWPNLASLRWKNGIVKATLKEVFHKQITFIPTFIRHLRHPFQTSLRRYVAYNVFVCRQTNQTLTILADWNRTCGQVYQGAALLNVFGGVLISVYCLRIAIQYSESCWSCWNTVRCDITCDDIGFKYKQHPISLFSARTCERF